MKACATVVMMVVLFAACGSGGDRDQVTQAYLEFLKDDSILQHWDEDCIRGLVEEFSDSDIAAFLESLDGGQEVQIPELETIGERIFTGCLDISAQRRADVADARSDASINADCFEAELVSAAPATSQGYVDALLPAERFCAVG